MKSILNLKYYFKRLVCALKFLTIYGSAVLGNHDYRGDVEAQLSPVLTNLDNRWFCMRSYVVNAGEKTILINIFIKQILIHDMQFLMNSYFVFQNFQSFSLQIQIPLWTHTLQNLGNMFMIGEAQGLENNTFPTSSRSKSLTLIIKKIKQNMLNFMLLIQQLCYMDIQQDVDLALKESNAKWKIVVGHHPIRSAAHHGDTKELVNQLLPILEVIKLINYFFFYIHLCF